MTDENEIGEEFNESFKRHQLIDKQTDKALDIVLRTNPIDVVLKNIDEDVDVPDEHRDSAERAQGMMQEWLEMYEGVLEESKDVPRDLIRRSAELAEEPLEQEYDD
jgi:uncharacterized protein (UPF0147 family)